MKSIRWALLLSLLLCCVALAEGPIPITGANWPLAAKFNKESVRLAAVEAQVFPQWIGKSDQFWYALRTTEGTKYYRVDPSKRTKAPLFDATKLASQLSELTAVPTDTRTLAITRSQINDEGTKLKFVVGEFQYEFDLLTEKLVKLGKAPPVSRFGPPRGGEEKERERQKKDEDDFREEKKEEPKKEDNIRDGYKNYSPDRKRFAFVNKNNLFLADEGKESEAVQLTTDGEEEYTFASRQFNRPGGMGGGTETGKMPMSDRKLRPNLTWSPDSKFFFATRSDARGIKELYLVDNLAQPRPTLEKYPYPMPGEDAIRKSEMFVYEVSSKKLNRVKPKYVDEFVFSPTWEKPEGELRYVRRDRLQRNLDFVAYDAKTNTEKVLLTEKFEAANLAFQLPRVVPESDEFIWWSERSGWGHFYLYGRDGKLRNAITSGEWRASRIVDVDAKNRLLYFVGNAREPNENIYYNHLYRVRFDGNDLTCLDPSPGSPGVVDPAGADHSSTLSPSKRFVVDNYSRVDLPSRSVLRDERGNVVMELEATNVDKLTAMGWKPPERFIVKAGDGSTDLYGNMWKPFDFNPNRKYPVIAHVYPGPQQEGVTHTFATYQTNMQLAQLGFIVIQVGHRGGAPTRSKAYHSYGYYNLRDYGLADKKAAIEQLGARFPWVDIERVGIYGHSGGAFMSAAAMLQKPYNDFFKAAVASAGNHDNNIYNNNWSEQYHGMKLIEAAETKDAKDSKSDSKMPPAKPYDDEPQDKKGENKKGDDKKAESKKDDVKKSDTKKDDAKKEENKKDDAKKSESKKDDLKKEETKKEAPKPKFDIKVPTNTELAGNLKGALLLVHGDMDNNVHHAGTMRLVDALIKANKRFDMLILPGKRHAFGDFQPYFTQRMWDFFAEHLLQDRQTRGDILDREMKRK